MVWKVLLGLFMTATILLSFFYAPEAVRPVFDHELDGMVEKPWPAFRIFYFHVPAAWIAVLGFLVGMIASIRVLRSGKREQDDVAMASSELGFLFCALALASGMIWARHEWGAYWHWDPRQTSVLVLLLIYGGYFTLRSSVADPARRARLAAVYSIVAFVTVPFLIFIIPRLAENTSHPSPVLPEGASSGGGEGGSRMNPLMRQVFYLFVLGYTGLYIWMLRLKVRIERLSRAVSA